VTWARDDRGILTIHADWQLAPCRLGRRRVQWASTFNPEVGMPSRWTPTANCSSRGFRKDRIHAVRKVSRRTSFRARVWQVLCANLERVTTR
jgi:hypothetical protein